MLPATSPFISLSLLHSAPPLLLYLLRPSALLPPPPPFPVCCPGTLHRFSTLPLCSCCTAHCLHSFPFHNASSFSTLSGIHHFTHFTPSFRFLPPPVCRPPFSAALVLLYTRFFSHLPRIFRWFFLHCFPSLPSSSFPGLLSLTSERLYPDASHLLPGSFHPADLHLWFPFCLICISAYSPLCINLSPRRADVPPYSSHAYTDPT